MNSMKYKPELVHTSKMQKTAEVRSTKEYKGKQWSTSPIVVFALKQKETAFLLTEISKKNSIMPKRHFIFNLGPKDIYLLPNIF